MVSLKSLVPKVSGELQSSLLSINSVAKYSLIALGIIAGRRIHLWIDENVKPATGMDTLFSFPSLTGGGTFVFTISDLLYIVATIPLVWLVRKLGSFARFIIYGLLVYIVVWELNEFLFGQLFGAESSSGLPAAPIQQRDQAPTTGSALSSTPVDL
jgi:hypothetical protein